jgi:beta-1,4-mannosyl-glycoprotein beta-1,4-N-acetylglucosaminyltransferase
MAKIWDCFMFGGELDLLEHRLIELGGVVDHFVLCESARTHSGREKPLHYRENRERFARWEKQIVHVVADLPEHATDAWRREELQRRSIRDLLRERVNPEDAIVMGDVDEFIDADVLRALAERCFEPVTMGMPHATYFANWWLPLPWGAPPVFARGSQLGEPLVRSLLGEPHEDWEGFRQRIVDDCGVHISYSGGANEVRKKFLGHPDTYLGDARYHRPGYIEWCIEYGVHFEGWGVLRRIPSDALPPLLQRLRARAPHLFDFTRAPSPAKTQALSGYALMRRSSSIPQRAVDWLDAHPAWVTDGPAMPAFFGIERARRIRSRLLRRPKPPFFIPLESSLRARHELAKHPEWQHPVHLSLSDLLGEAAVP